MTDRPLRRVVKVLLMYLGVVWMVLGVGGWLRRALALPRLFETLLEGGLIGGAFVAVGLAWAYPSLAAGDEPERSGDRSPGGRPEGR